MNIENIKLQFRKRDRVISVLSDDGLFRVSLINNTNTARIAQEKHNLSKTPAILLAKQLASASLLAVFLKGEERIILEASGNGVISKVFAEAIQVGEVRGFVSFNSEKNIESMMATQSPLGIGLYRVTKIIYSKPEPVTGLIELQNGDISSDLTYYFFQSEQIPTLVILDVTTNDKGIIGSSAGLIIQAMPDATNESLEKIYESVSQSESLSVLFQHYDDQETILSKLLPFKFSINKHDSVDFYCRCSKDSFKSKLLTLDLKELKGMKEENHNELTCQFCNSRYFLEQKDFDELIAQVQAKHN